MKEKDYITVTNLTALRIASDALGRIMLEGTPEYAEFSEARKQLKPLEIKLEER